MASIRKHLSNLLSTHPKNWLGRPSDRHRAEYGSEGWLKDTALGIRDAVVDRVAADYRAQEFELDADEGEYFMLKNERREIALSPPLDGTLGRGSAANWTVMGADLRREHATIKTTDRGIIIEAIDDAEVRLNGRPIQRALLQPGDELGFGRFVTFEVQLAQRNHDFRPSVEEETDRRYPQASRSAASHQMEELRKLAQGGERRSSSPSDPSSSDELAPPRGAGALGRKANEILAAQRDSPADTPSADGPALEGGSRQVSGPAGSVDEPGWWGRVRDRLTSLEGRISEEEFDTVRQQAQKLQAIDDPQEKQQAYQAWWQETSEMLLKAAGRDEKSSSNPDQGQPNQAARLSSLSDPDQGATPSQ